MGKRFVEEHIVDCLRAAIVEANGDKERAARLRAQAKLRLILMSDAEVWELAKRTSSPPKRSVLEAYRDIKATIVEYKATAEEWLPQAVLSLIHI